MGRRIPFLKILLLTATVAAVIAVTRYYTMQPLQPPAHAKPALTQTAPEIPAASENAEHEAKMLNSALKKNPGHVPILIRLAKLASDSGHSSEAIDQLQQVLQHDSNNVEARLDLGKLLFEGGNVRAAVDQNEAILKIQPDHPDALYNLGAIYGNLGSVNQAEHYWNRLLITNPESESGKRARGMMTLLTKEAKAKK